MKRNTIFIFIAILILTISGCSADNNFAGATFEKPLQTETNNELRYNNSVYLTNDKFFFTTEDKNKTNTFDNPTKLVAYNLLNGEKDYPITFSHGEIKNMVLVENKLYFVTYTNTSTDWGYCLFSLDTDTYEVERIYETHNTVDDICLACSGDSIYYLCCADNHSYELHRIKDDNDTVIKDKIICNYGDLYSYNSDIYIIIYRADGLTDCYTIDSESQMKKTDDDNIPLYSDIAKGEKISNKLLSGKFGKYYILEDKIPEESIDTDECGYEYTIGYYLFDSETKERYNLCEATYWYYYI